MSRLFLVLMLVSPVALVAQKARRYTDVTTELAKNVATANLPVSPMRLAVVPITATSASIQSSMQFEEYLTESVIARLGNHTDKIKLFERTRLDAILREHEFILTDMMKPAAVD